MSGAPGENRTSKFYIITHTQSKFINKHTFLRFAFRLHGSGLHRSVHRLQIFDDFFPTLIVGIIVIRWRFFIPLSSYIFVEFIKICNDFTELFFVHPYSGDRLFLYTSLPFYSKNERSLAIH